jgi:hypothetical protein
MLAFLKQSSLVDLAS